MVELPVELLVLVLVLVPVLVQGGVDANHALRSPGATLRASTRTPNWTTSLSCNSNEDKH